MAGRRIFHALYLAACLGLGMGVADAQVRLVDTDAAIGELLKPYLPTTTVANADDAQRLQYTLGQELPAILATEGYFQPVLAFTPDGNTLRLQVNPGPRTTIRKLVIDIQGEVDPARRQALLDAWSLQPGRPFRQADWDRAKQQLLSQLLALDFRAAELRDSRADIVVADHAADLHLTYVAGPAYRFGPLRIEGLARYDATLIARYNRDVQPGRPYSEAALTNLQAALQGSGYFASVQVDTVPAEAVPDAEGALELPVHLRLREQQPHRLSFGAGASSNTGARVETTYSTADFLHQAWKLNTGVRIEEKKQTFFSDLFLPPAAANYQPSVGFMAEKTDIANLQTERYAFGVQRAQRRGSVDATYALNWQQENTKPADATETTSHALAANGQWIWHHLDSILNPRAGQTLQLALSAASAALMSDRSFVRSYLRLQQYFPVGERDTLGLRVELGRTFAGGRDGIPEEYLFRSGGTNSVRGYGYNSLGVKDGTAVVGGRYLATASIEYTHWLHDSDWGVATFIDAGNAADALSDLKPKYGKGFGARWRSPAGPIAVDLAWGQGSSAPRLHFFLAIPF